MRTIKRVGAICAILGGIAGSVVAFSAPAQAAGCPADRLCLFSEWNYGGTRAVYQWGSPDLRGQGVATPGSYINNDNIRFCLYFGKNYTGNSKPLPPHSRTTFYSLYHFQSAKPC